MFLSFKVYLLSNKDDGVSNFKPVNIHIIPISLANNTLTKPSDRKKFPNPLFYGDRINKKYVWYNPYPKLERHLITPTRNLAILYLNRSKTDYDFLNSNIKYPVIDADPSNFIYVNKTVSMFKLSTLNSSNNNYNLFKFPFTTHLCESSFL